MLQMNSTERLLKEMQDRKDRVLKELKALNMVIGVYKGFVEWDKQVTPIRGCKDPWTDGIFESQELSPVLPHKAPSPPPVVQQELELEQTKGELEGVINRLQRAKETLISSSGMIKNRTRNALFNNKIYSIYDLCSHKYSSLRLMRGIGKDTLDDLETYLKTKGYAFEQFLEDAKEVS